MSVYVCVFAFCVCDGRVPAALPAVVSTQRNFLLMSTLMTITTGFPAIVWEQLRLHSVLSVFERSRCLLLWVVRLAGV